MSHTLAARCTVCGAIENGPCPECPGVLSSAHGTVDQKPWRYLDVGLHGPGWHPDCVPEEEK